MKNVSVTNSIRTKYIDEYLESAKKINYTDLTEKDGLTKVFYDELPITEIKGYPVASEYVAPDGTAYPVTTYLQLPKEMQKLCRLRFYYLPYSHELYIGTTGSGKTTGCVEPQLRAISSQKNKPNLFLTDPKGELFDRNAQHLINQGYVIKVVNFKDLIRSDKWNPLMEIYDLKMQLIDIGKGAKAHSGKPKQGLKLMAREDEFGAQYVEYDGMAFPDGEVLDRYVGFRKDYLEATIDGLINQIVNMMIVVQSKTDRSWEMGAQDLLKGILHCMLEDAIDPKSGFTRDMMTLRTLQQYYLTLKVPILSGDTSLHSHSLMRNKSAKAKSLMATALGNAPNTMRSYCGVFDGALKDWFQGHIFALTTGNTVELPDEDTPVAIFLITRDYEKSDFLIAGLFIDWVYRQMLERAEGNENPRALHFLLDEFANIPEIKDLENKISTSRSRNIWFHLVVQSYKQIDLIYTDNRSVVIKDNCNAQIFLGAQNRDSKEVFSRECGKHFIPTLESRLNPSDNSITEAPLIPVSDLDLIKPGEIYTKRLYMPVITSQFIRSYMCAEQGAFTDYFHANGLKNCTPFNIESFTSDKYTFHKVSKDPFNEY